MTTTRFDVRLAANHRSLPVAPAYLVAIATCVASLSMGCAEDDSAETGMTEQGPEEQEPTFLEEPEATYFGGVKSILDAHCVSCHTQDGIAPFPLTTYEEARTHAALIAFDTAARIMPPFLADSSIRDYRYDITLSEEQIGLLHDWAEADAPEGDPNRLAPPLEVERGTLDRTDITVGLPEPYTPVLEPDEYRCFPLDWPLDTISYVTGHVAEPDNITMTHHLVAFLIPPGFASTVHDLDEASEGAGYPCFGSPSGDAETDFPVQTLGTWAPGIGGIELPEGTGIKIVPGSVIVLQMHYSVVEWDGRPDQTKMHFRIEDDVETQGHYIPFFNIEWFIDPSLMHIPAGEDDAQHSYRTRIADIPFLAIVAPDLNPTVPLNVHSALPHQHKRGTEIGIRAYHPDGSDELLIHLPRWDFDWQQEYFLKEPLHLERLSELEIFCRWDNSDANQPIVRGERLAPQDIAWGDGTFDEMCISYLYVTEASD